MPTTPPVLELERITRRYRPEVPPVFSELSLVLRAGEYLAIMASRVPASRRC